MSKNALLWSQRSFTGAWFVLPDPLGPLQEGLIAGNGEGLDVTGDGTSDLIDQHAHDIKGLIVGVTVLPGDGTPEHTLGPFGSGKGAGLVELPARTGGDIIGGPVSEIPPLVPGGEEQFASDGYVVAYTAGGHELWRAHYSGDDLKVTGDLHHDGKPDLQLGEGGPVISSATGRTLRGTR